MQKAVLIGVAGTFIGLLLAGVYVVVLRVLSGGPVEPQTLLTVTIFGVVGGAAGFALVARVLRRR